MEKKVTRRIIGILVVVALVIILLPLININDSQSTLQTAEVKAPPFPDPQSENTPPETIANSTTPATTDSAGNETKTADNSSPSIHSIIQNFVSPTKTDPNTPQENKSPQATDTNPTVVSQNTAALHNSAPPGPQQLPESNTATQEVTLASNTDADEEVEQAESDNVLLKDAKVAAENNPPKIDATVAPVKTEAQAAAAPVTVAATPKAETKAAPVVVATKAVVKTTPKTEKPVTVANKTEIKTTPKTVPPVTVASQTDTTSQPQPKTQLPVMVVTKTEPKAEPSLEPKIEAQQTEPTKIVKKASINPDAPDLSLNKKTKPAVDVATQEEINQVKQSAWVVQLGSFRSKVNAERLTNSLRAKGYKAFTYETKSNGQTRVYVGPQFKQASAATIASKIETDMKMHGIVVSFKPLEI